MVNYLCHQVLLAIPGGNYYIADYGNNRIRKVNSAGIITTIAGISSIGGFSGDNGPATAAQLGFPSDIALDAAGNIYFTDKNNNRIRKINTSGIITTIAGTGALGYNGDNIPATDAYLHGPGGIATDGAGNVYFCDALNGCVRKINASGIVTTVAGTCGSIWDFNGDEIPATTAQFCPGGIAVDARGNIFIADAANNRIRKVDTAGIIHTIAGNGIAGFTGDGGQATNARLSGPSGVYVDNYGNVYICDIHNYVIRKVNNLGIISTFAGNGVSGFSGDGGPATVAQIGDTYCVTADAANNIYIADASNNRIRFITSTLLVPEVDDANDVSVYPNPCEGDLTILFTSVQSDDVQGIITDMSGRVVIEFAVRTNTPLDLVIDQPPGIYVIAARSSSRLWHKRIVVVR